MQDCCAVRLPVDDLLHLRRGAAHVCGLRGLRSVEAPALHPLRGLGGPLGALDLSFQLLWCVLARAAPFKSTPMLELFMEWPLSLLRCIVSRSRCGAPAAASDSLSDLVWVRLIWVAICWGRPLWLQFSDFKDTERGEQAFCLRRPF